LSRRQRGWFGTVREGQEACPADCARWIRCHLPVRARRQGGRGKLEAQQIPHQRGQPNHSFVLSSRNEPTDHSSQIQFPYMHSYTARRPASSRSATSTPKKKNTPRATTTSNTLCRGCRCPRRFTKATPLGFFTEPATKKCSANPLSSLVNRDAEGGHGVAQEVCRREQQEGDHDVAGRVGPRPLSCTSASAAWCGSIRSSCSKSAGHQEDSDN
jgi:hypothetical protein